MTDDALPTEPSPSWQPLTAGQRRVAGVLVEKAKTTPAAYPLTLNALKAGCNQKSNRYPTMQLDDEPIHEALDHLRKLGAVMEVQGDGRVPKYRHLLYEWLGVDKVEMAVMAELLLRGAQTVGELRGRAARMAPIADLPALRPVLDALEHKRLIVYLTPAGRGCTVTHALYHTAELDQLRSHYFGSASMSPGRAASSPLPASAGAAAVPRAAPGGGTESTAEIDQLKSQLQSVREEVQELREELRQLTDALRGDLDDVKQQLGV